MSKAQRVARQAALALLSLAAVVRADPRIRGLVLEGDDIAGVGHVTSIENLAVNDRGEWLVEVDTDNPDTNSDGVLLKDGAVFRREGGALATPAGAWISGSGFDALALDPSGHVTLNLALGGTGSVLTDGGIFHESVLVIQEGSVSTAPQFSPDTPYGSFLDVKINRGSELLIVGTVDDSAIPSISDPALLRLQLAESGALLSTTVIAKEGDVLPGSGQSIVNFGTGSRQTALNDAGDVLYFVQGNGSSTSDGAIYLNDVLVAQEGGNSPVAGRNFEFLSGRGMALNNRGDVAYEANLMGSTSDDEFIVKNGAVLVREGGTLPAVSPYSFQFFGVTNVGIDEEGEVLWYGDWNDPNTDVDSGLFLDEALIVQEGVTTVDGVPLDIVNTGEDAFRISPRGRYILFEGTLTGGINGAFLLDRCAATAGETDCNSNGAADACEIAYGAEDCDEDGLLDECVVHFRILQTGPQMVPPVATAARCSCGLDIEVSTRQLTVNCTYAGLTGNLTLASLHGPAASGVNAGVLQTFPNPGGHSGAFAATTTLTPLNLQRMRDGLTYLSLHTSAHPAGEVRGQIIADCDDNSIADICELAAGARTDCNTNGVLDDCEIALGAPDCNSNTLLDDCEPDCDRDLIPDDCEIAGGSSADCQGDGYPDDCQLAATAPDEHAYALDDGTAESSVQTGLGELCWLNQFQVVPGAEQITALDIAIGHGLQDPPAGTPLVAYVWNDPDQDGDPSDARVLASTAGFAPGPGVHGLLTHAIPPVVVGPAGTSFFVGVMMTTATAPAAIDRDPPYLARSWVAAGPPGGLDPADLGGAALPVERTGDVSPAFAGNWLIRARGVPAGTDCNHNGVPDQCDLAEDPRLDCNGNGLLDACDVANGAEDCNTNGVPDACELAAATAADCDGDGIPDACLTRYLFPMTGAQLAPPGTTAGSGICEVTLNAATGALDIACTYANLSGVVIGVHLHGSGDYGVNAAVMAVLAHTGGQNGTASRSLTLSAAQVQSMLAGLTYLSVKTTAAPAGEIRGQVDIDCIANGPPTACAPDCDADGIADGCAIRMATSADADSDGLPDDCDPCVGLDINGDGEATAADAESFASCLGGPTAAHGGGNCACLDLDTDGDVDLGDFAEFVRRLTP